MLLSRRHDFYLCFWLLQFWNDELIDNLGMKSQLNTEEE